MATCFMQRTAILLHCTPLVIIFCSFSSRLCPLGLLSLTSWIFCSAPKCTECLFHMDKSEKILLSIHHTNRKKKLFPLFFSKYRSLLLPTAGQTQTQRDPSVNISVTRKQYKRRILKGTNAIRKLPCKPWATETVHSICITVSRRFFKS